MMGGNRHKETAQRAPSNSKNTWPENYIQHVQTISTKKYECYAYAASCCALPLRILRLAHLDHCVKGIVQ